MPGVSVKQLAGVLGVPVDRLLAQLTKAGLPMKSAEETVSDDQKAQLLSFLRDSHGTSKTASTPSKITLKRKSVSELKQSTTTGGRGAKTRTVSVEVRKKRTYVKRSVAIAEENERLKAEKEEKEKLLKAKEDLKKKLDKKYAATKYLVQKLKDEVRETAPAGEAAPVAGEPEVTAETQVAEAAPSAAAEEAAPKTPAKDKAEAEAADAKKGKKGKGKEFGEEGKGKKGKKRSDKQLARKMLDVEESVAEFEEEFVAADERNLRVNHR